MKPFHILCILLLAVTLAGCGGATVDASVTSEPPPGTPLPTVAPVAEGDAATLAAEVAQEGWELLYSARGDVDPQAEAIFGVTGEAGVAMRIEARVHIGQPDLVLELSTPGSDVLARVDASGPGQSEVISEFLVPTTGYYEMAIQSLEGTGVVDVLVYQLSPEILTGGGVIPGFDQPVRGSMDRPATIHTYRLPVERAQRFDLWATATSGDLDLLFELYDPQGNLVASRDDDLNFDPYVFNVMPPASGEYTIVLTNYEQTTGNYEIMATRSQSSGQLSFGTRQLVSLPLEPAHGVFVEFIGVAGDGISISAEPINPGIDLTLAVHDVFGNELVFANRGGQGEGERLGRVQLPYDGPYQLEFGTLREGGEVRYDAYERTPFDFDTGGPEIVFPTTRNVTVLESGTTHVYWFDGQEGQRITLDATTLAGTMDLAFDLFGPPGNLLSARDDDRGRDPVLENYPLPFTGRYYVVLKTGDDHLGGQYRLTATTPAPPDEAPGG